MNKILALFREEEARAVLEKEVLPMYPNFKKIIRVEIKPYKKMIWETTYHVVIAYEVTFLKNEGGEEHLQLICSAHSEEPREKAYEVLRFLWESGLDGDGVVLPRPLFYSSYYKGFFYRAIEGNNLLHYIRKDDRPALETNVVRAAEMLAKLHNLPLPVNTNIFSEDNRRLLTVVPGRDTVIREISERFQGAFADDMAAFYDYFVAAEESFFASTDERWLIHGDAHPENIIAVGENKIGMIDFSDFCPADFARDLGSFMQQLEYKIVRNLNDQAYAIKLKRLFLDTYINISGYRLDDNLQRRLDLYFNFTAARNTNFWLLKHDCEPEKAVDTIKKIKEYLRTNHHAQD